MEHSILDSWLSADPTRTDWLARKLGVSYEYIRLMRLGRRAIPATRAMQIAAAMRVREKADKLLAT